MTGIYYNENDPGAVSWLRRLIATRQLPPGEVDSRSIIDVTPDDLRGFHQCHFFAGIGGWPLAARLAGWPDKAPLWTGSCPCQPFSVIGEKRAFDDERHLWPDFFRLICAIRPAVVMGEQVTGALGAAWLDGVGIDLESADYTFRAVSLPAAAVNAPHIRERAYWLAVEHSHRPRREGVGGQLQEESALHSSTERADARCWDYAQWIECRDGRLRRTKPGVPLLVDGFPGRVAALHGLGNAIVPLLAVEVIGAFLDAYEL